MRRIFRPLIRMSAFISKEISEVLRQPRLLFTLVLGPFLILLIFGIGYRNQPRALRTVFVAGANTSIARQIQEYATTLGPQLVFMGVTSDENAAMDRLRRGEVDLVAVTPSDAYQTIRSSKQAVFTLYHHEIDPFQVDYVTYFGQVYIDEVNRRVLLAITQQGQKDASSIKQDVEAARANASAMRQAYQAGDDASARINQAQLSQNVDSVSLAVGASLGLLSGVQQSLGEGGNTDAGAIQAALNDVRQNTNDLNTANSSSDNSQKAAKSSKIEQDLAILDTQLTEFTAIDANVIVRPFRSETKSIAPVQPSAMDFFTPAVIALLLQHLAITFAALSIVRERTVGTMELFRVSPLTAGETLFGKYLSYMLFGATLSAILTGLLIYVLHVPMLGNWTNYALVVAGLLFTSMGIGFIISLVSQTDSQAVQYTMILLLTSVFFSGFLLNLDMIWKPVRVLSWSLPTTYGIVMLRDIMLRGNAPSLLLLIGLPLIGLGLFLLSWLLLRRMITTR
ncbi:MAG TPA: ABC transporter permease [Anaerolineales bacterium]